MESRNILDNLGNIIGILELPEGTSETIWTEKLSEYSQVVVNSSKRVLDTITVTGSGTTTTSSSTASTIQGMEVTPQSGKYIINFTGSIYTAGASAVGEFGIFIDGVQIADTRRDISCNIQLLGGLVTVSLNAIGVGTNTATEIDINENQKIEVMFRSTNGGTIGFKERSMTLLKVQ